MKIGFKFRPDTVGGWSLGLLAFVIATQSACGATRIAAVDEAIRAEIAAGHTAGAVMLVMKDGKLLHHSALGQADRERGKAMTTDSVFWIASMTKSISATTILSLVDEGKLSLDEPASKWLPELGKMKLADGKPPRRPITLRDLMSHTSGLAFPPRKANDGAQSLKGYVAQLLRAPLEFEPGSGYHYGFGITVAGRIAEIVSGKPYDVLVQDRILNPLSMTDTAFFPDERLRARIAQSYKTAESGSGLVPAYNPFFTSGVNVHRMTEPSGGLFSTAAALARFYQMILDGGVYRGKRIVSQKAIEEMTRPHHTDKQVLNYGLGWQCSNPIRAMIPGFSKKAFGHGGAYATHGWIDPERRTVTVFMVQNVLVKDGNKPRGAFHAAVFKELER